MLSCSSPSSSSCCSSKSAQQTGTAPSPTPTNPRTSICQGGQPLAGHQEQQVPLRPGRSQQLHPAGAACVVGCE